MLDEELALVQQYLKQCITHNPAKTNHADKLIFAQDGEILSEAYISEMTQVIFDEILGEGHGYTFHNFRHSAANHFSNRLVRLKRDDHDSYGLHLEPV